MNIIDFLQDDHDNIRRRLVQIRKALSRPSLREQIREFIGYYELHESVEEEMLFPAVLAALKNSSGPRPLPPGFSGTHREIWELLDRLMDGLNQERFGELQEAFFKFAASAEAHMAHEERVLFPAIRDRVGDDKLEELGKKAEERYARAHGKREVYEALMQMQDCSR